MVRTPSNPNVRVRPTPRLSANELANYMVVSDTARLGILSRSKYAVTATTTRYKAARNATKAYLTDPRRSISIVDQARATLDQQAEDSSLTDFRQDDARKSADALESLVRMQNLLGGYDFVAAPPRPPTLNINGVEISVAVDALVHRTIRSKDKVGGLLLRFTKADDESETAAARRRERGAYAAAIVYMQVAQNFAGSRQPHNSICLSVDVQAEDIHVAPRNFRRRLSDIESACRVISAIWPTL